MLGAFQPPRVQTSAPVTLPRDGRSFPSSHASNNFCAAVIIASFYRRWGWLAIIPAALVAWSRVYVGSHWPSDALVSSFLGAGTGLCALAALEAAWRKWGDHLLPRLHARRPSLAA